jgi:thermostable 8-oxoguanine DNA glycosylase
MVDKEFILRWEKKYDDKEHDEKEYREIIKLLKSRGGIPRGLFERIVRWKSARIIGKVNWNNFKKYSETLNSLTTLDDKEKLKELTDLPGVGIPLASTILHFRWPEKFPIIDKRTTGVLKHFGYINWKTISEKNYWEFKKTLDNIKKNLQIFSLRQIDRALFAFHKNG